MIFHSLRNLILVKKEIILDSKPQLNAQKQWKREQQVRFGLFSEARREIVVFKPLALEKVSSYRNFR